PRSVGPGGRPGPAVAGGPGGSRRLRRAGGSPLRSVTRHRRGDRVPRAGELGRVDARDARTPPGDDGSLRTSLGSAMKISIVGTGAMGAVYAALLRKAGHEVWAIDPWREHVDAIAGAGLRVSGASGTYVVDGIRAGATPADSGPSDVWIVATKAA